MSFHYYKCIESGNISFCILLKDMPLYPNELKEGILTSGKENGDYKLEIPRGSCYLQMKYLFDHYLNLYGDWNWLVNFRTREILRASKFEALSKRYILFIFYKLLSILI